MVDPKHIDTRPGKRAGTCRVKIPEECEGGIEDQVKHCDRQNEKTDRSRTCRELHPPE